MLTVNSTNAQVNTRMNQGCTQRQHTHEELDRNEAKERVQG